MPILCASKHSQRCSIPHTNVCWKPSINRCTQARATHTKMHIYITEHMHTHTVIHAYTVLPTLIHVCTRRLSSTCTRVQPCPCTQCTNIHMVGWPKRLDRLFCAILWRNPIQRWTHVLVCRCCCLVVKLCPTLWDPMDCSPPGSSVHGILPARIPEWVAISYSKASSQPRDRTHVSCIGRQILYH